MDITASLFTSRGITRKVMKMYKFKVGDTVRCKHNMHEEYVIVEITPSGWRRKCVGDKTNSYQAKNLELVCPAGYRPVRKDEMHEGIRIGDAAISSYGVLRKFDTFAYHMSYGLALSCTDLDCRYVKFFRPIRQKLEYGWCDEFSVDCENGECGLTEEAAKAAAEKFSRENSVETLVYKIVGKFTVKTETKVEWNEI